MSDALTTRDWASSLAKNPSFRDRFVAVLHQHFTPESFETIMIQALTMQPALQACERGSIYAAMMKCARLGIEPLGQYEGGWLIPRKGRAEFQISYDGLLRVVSETVPLVDVRAEIVHDNDKLEYRPTDDERPIDHTVDIKAERGAPVGAWCILRVAQGEHVGKYVSYLTYAEIERRRQMGGRGPAWKQHWASMAKKTVLHDAFRMVPKKVSTGAAALWEEEVSPQVVTARVEEESDVPTGVSEYIGRLK